MAAKGRPARWLAVAIAIGVTACGEPIQRKTAEVFGTLAEVIVFGGDERTASEVVREFERLQKSKAGAGEALDQALRILRSNGVRNALASIGGASVVLGEKGTRPWRLGIPHPLKPGPIASVELRDGEVLATEGRYLSAGAPRESIAAVTVLLPPGDQAGARTVHGAKALLDAGPPGWREAARRLGIEAALLIDNEGAVHITPALARRIDFRLPLPVVHERP